MIVARGFLRPQIGNADKQFLNKTKTKKPEKQKTKQKKAKQIKPFQRKNMNFWNHLFKLFSKIFTGIVYFPLLRSSRPEEFLGKSVLKIYSKFTGVHPCQRVIQRHFTEFTKRTLLLKCDFNLQSNFIEITQPHGCSPINLLHIYRTPFSRNNSGRLLLITATYQFNFTKYASTR